MKKLLVAVPLVVVIGGAAAPFVVGSKIETVAKQHIELSNQQLAQAVAGSPQLSNAKIELDSYEKGYLNATATGKITFTENMNFEGATTYTIPFTSEIQHGPYLGDAGFGAASIVTRPDLSGFQLPKEINEDTIIMTTLVGVEGDLKNNVVVAPIFAEEDGKTFDFAGAVMNSVSPSAANRATFTGDIAVKQFKFSDTGKGEIVVLKPLSMTFASDGKADFSQGTYSVNSSALEILINDDEGSVVLEKIDMQGSYEKAKGVDNFVTGSGEFTLENIVVTNQDLPEPLKLPKVSFGSRIEQNNGTDFDISATYSAVLDSSLMKVMSSPVDVKTADVSIKITSISVAVIEEYQALVKAFMTAGKENGPAVQAMQAKALGIAKLLVNNASAANIEVHATSTEGNLDADIDLGFKPGLALSEAELMGLFGGPDPSKLLAVLVGRGDVTLDKGITDKAGVTPMIQVMAADFVTLESDTFKSEIKITDGQLLVNGTPLPMMAH